MLRSRTAITIVSLTALCQTLYACGASAPGHPAEDSRKGNAVTASADDYDRSAPMDAKASGAVRYPIADFFLTNAICRNSPTMQRCSEELVHGVSFQEAAE